ncbi:MAG: MobF family relaxase [Egibacteraceae bacterium]
MGAHIGDNSKIGTGAGRQADYYIEELAETQRDYYTGRGEAPGEWAGGLADALDLQGQLTPEQFTSVLEGVHPITGEPLKPHINLKNQGLDITFDLPKSFSAFYALADEHAQAVMHQAVREALDNYAIPYLEEYACVARLGAQGKDRTPGTGFVVTLFTHRQSREGDPHLHVHAIFANVVHTQDGRAAAPDMHMLYAHHKTAGALFEAGVRHVLWRDLALDFTERNEQLEIAGIPAELCHMWSTRRAQILAKLDEWGADSARARQDAAYATRKAKDDPGGERRLHERWRGEGAQWERSRRPFGRASGRLYAGHDRLSDTDIIDRLTGPDGLTEKASSFGRRDVAQAVAKLVEPCEATAERISRIAAAVLRDGRVLELLKPGRATSGELMQVRDKTGKVVRCIRQHEHRYTTQGLVLAEQEVIDRTAARVASGAALVPSQIVERVLARHAYLDPDQQAAVRGLCASGNGIDVVIGRAGSGKSAMLKAYREACEEAGLPVRGVAPSATAAHLLGRSAGIPATCTVHRLLEGIRKAGWRLPTGGVVVLDEAGMADTRTLLELQQAADEAGCKLVGVGDPRQTPSVDVGGLLPRIAEATRRVFELTRNHRFARPGLQTAAEQVRDGDTAQGIEALRRLGMVHEYDTADQAAAATVDMWVALRTPKNYPGCERVFEVASDGFTRQVATPGGVRPGEDARIFADLNVNIDQLNRRAREALVDAGQVAAGRTYTDEATGDWVSLGEGDRVRLGHNQTGVAQPDGTRVSVRNGMEGQIVDAGRDGVVVRLDEEHKGEDGRSSVWLPHTYVANEVALGYALTCDKGTAANHDHGLYLATDRASLERGYVALSRGRYSNRVYATRSAAWEQALGTSRAHEPATGQQPTPDDRGQPGPPIEADRNLSVECDRDRWLAKQAAQLEAERQARQAVRENDGHPRDEGRGRGMAM